MSELIRWLIDTFHFSPQKIHNFFLILFLGNETRRLKPDYFLKSNEGRTQLRRWFHGGEFGVVLNK